RAAKEQIERIREDAGDRFERLELNALVQDVVITTDHDTGIERLRPELTGLTSEEIATSPYLLVGTVEEIIDQLVERREQLGVSYYVVFEKSMEHLAPIVEQLSGK